MEKEYVTYEEFGAVGDGKTDDMDAIVRTHEYANEHGLPVRAKEGAQYYVGGRDLTAVIRTSCDFRGATFFIDDSKGVERVGAAVFKIAGDYDYFDVKIDRLDRGQKKLDLPHEGNLYVKVYNDNKRVYIRYGDNANTGVPQEDCFTLDPEGNIGSTLPWQFDEVTRAQAKCCDDKPIVIEGGRIVTIANRDPREKYRYYSRNLFCNRSHTTLKNVVLDVIGESEVQGSPYAGSLSISSCVDVTIDHCVLSPHKTYYWTMDNGHINAYGTYGFGANSAIGLHIIGLTQSKDIMDNRYWGLFGTNFCKDMELTDCKVSRFDAHQGVINMKLTNCEFGHVKMEVIGFGVAELENVQTHGGYFMLLRGDYGSFFKGDMYIRNSAWEILPGNKKATFFNASNDGKHDFGYVCELPRHLVIENLLIDDENAPEDYEGTFIFNKFDRNFSEDRPYPYVVPETVTLKNVRTKSGRGFKLFEDEVPFKNTKVIIED